MKGLFIIDVQKGFTKDKEFIKKLNKLNFSSYETIYVTQFYNQKNSFFNKLLEWDKMEKNSLEFELAFTPPPNSIIIEKPQYSFLNSAIIKRLNSLDIKEVHLCGIDTDNCVLISAVNLIENGFRPVVLSKYCMSSAGDDYHKSGLRILKRFIGKKQVR